jgi:hypothetical protein
MDCSKYKLNNETREGERVKEIPKFSLPVCGYLRGKGMVSLSYLVPLCK